MPDEAPDLSEFEFEPSDRAKVDEFAHKLRESLGTKADADTYETTFQALKRLYPNPIVRETMFLMTCLTMNKSMREQGIESLPLDAVDNIFYALLNLLEE